MTAFLTSRTFRQFSPVQEDYRRETILVLLRSFSSSEVLPMKHQRHYLKNVRKTSIAIPSAKLSWRSHQLHTYHHVFPSMRYLLSFLLQQNARISFRALRASSNRSGPHTCSSSSHICRLLFQTVLHDLPPSHDLFPSLPVQPPSLRDQLSAVEN